MKPTIGRIVRFVLPEGVGFRYPGEHRPAIIVKVWSDTCVNLQVFLDGTNDLLGGPGTVWYTSVVQDEETKFFRTWHWSETSAE